MYKILSLIQFCKSQHLVSTVLYIEKMLDTLECSDLFTLLANMGLENNILRISSTIYKQQTTNIITNNIKSPSINLQRGTREGYPLSLLLFTTATEPMAIASKF